MMVMEPATILLDRAIVGNGYIGASGCQPGGQQPQVMSHLAGKRWRGVVVRPMGQRQVMLGIEKIDVNHMVQR